MITTYGIKCNTCSGMIQSEVTLDDLFIEVWNIMSLDISVSFGKVYVSVYYSLEKVYKYLSFSLEKVYICQWINNKNDS